VNNEDSKGGDEAFSILAQKITRLDAYSAQSKCLDTYDVRPFCYCRNLASGGQ
ncbi:hypothetical protein AAVH_21738, partial [Aphelenchoides avenae]